MLVTRKWVDDAKVNWGEDSPMYQIRVLGDFPSESEDTLISLKIIENAVVGKGRGSRLAGRRAGGNGRRRGAVRQ